MVTLAIDTSHPTGTVALARDGAVVGTERFETPSSHLVALARAVESLLALAGCSVRDVRRVAVVIGPGSFTGLRIGLSFAKGLHAAVGTDIATIDSLRLLALPLLADHARVCALIDARRGEVYGAVFARRPGGTSADVVVEVAPCARKPADFLSALTDLPDVFVGSGVAAAAEAVRARFPGASFAPAPDSQPSTALLARIAADLPALDHDGVRGLEPFYLRPSGAERVRLRRHSSDA